LRTISKYELKFLILLFPVHLMLHFVVQISMKFLSLTDRLISKFMGLFYMWGVVVTSHPHL